MIVYETNKNWLRDISHLARSWTMTKIMRAVLAVGVFTAILCVIELTWFNFMGMSNATGIFSLLGIVLSILLVFRTNTAYDRWWEGRKQWGALVNNARNLAIMAQVTFPHEQKEERVRMATLIANFCIAFKEHLRKGVKLEELIHLSPSDKEVYPKLNHVPAYISTQIHDLVHSQYRKGTITPYDWLNFKPEMKSLMDILGACERIKKTPIPFSYNVYIKLFITIYVILLPIAVIPEFGFWSVPIVMLVFFAFIGVQLMAEEIEEPFGLDCNDLPTGDIAHTIKNNVFEILDARTVPSVVHHEYEKVF
ncbi:bestrophin family ion channel [Cytophagales bacterium LB-30]|uniref:Bestrophin family ion channel n=1 Tax=Shiella aurantiaca TaxID=3058365 RepID=A0ABT8F7R2_9BACT|nr:bestrophin family ion channel [Shiella aurantiaca]MDN4166433.1 bestrophin family ion channel [Shiella aurantiaca]